MWVTVLGAALSMSVETLQLFTRDRISSVSDVTTNTIGALIGALMIQSVRDVPTTALRFLKRRGFIDRPAFYAFLVAVIVVCLAQWEPFDVTIDVSSVYSKVKALRVDLWQYSGLNDEGVAFTQFALFGAAAYAWLQELGASSPAQLAMVLGIPLAFGLEASQIFIGSRMPGLEDALVRGAGVAVGVLLWSIGRQGRSRRGWVVLVVAATAVGAGMQMLNPFELATTPNAVQWLPFMNYYEVTTFTTLSHALELVLIYFPLGFVIARMRPGTRRSSWMIAIAITLAIAVPIEFLQRFVVGRFPDATDPTLSAIGGWLGAWAGTSGAAYFEATVARLETTPRA
jgi:VanZ family protein